MPRSRFVAGCVILTVVAGCSGTPAVSLGRDAVSSRFDGGKSTRVTLVDFSKTDGQASELMGVRLYMMQFTAVAEFTDDAYYTTGGVMQPNDDILTRPASKTPPNCQQNLAACLSERPVLAKKGDRLTFSGSATFEKRESGWHVVHVEMSLVKARK